MNVNKSALLKSLGIGLIFTTFIALILKNLLFGENLVKVLLGYLIIIVWFGTIVYKNYQRYVWEESFNYYVKKFHLTPEKLSQITGRSKFEFFEVGKGEIKFPARNHQIRLDILKSLEKMYGPKLSEKSEY